MRYLMFLIITLVLFACKKEDTFDSTPEYLSIVGEWRNIDGDGFVSLEINEDGSIYLLRNDERSVKFTITNISKTTSYGGGGVIWDALKLMNLSEEITVSYNPERDTIYSQIGFIEPYLAGSKFVRK